MSRRSVWFAALRRRREEKPAPRPQHGGTISVPALLRGRWRLDDDDPTPPDAPGGDGVVLVSMPDESAHFRAALPQGGSTFEVTE